MNRFIALDVETANADMASICQIGLIEVQDGKILDEWSSYVDPADYFNRVNVSIHGIDESKVAGAPSFIKIADLMYPRLEGNIVVCHTHFDRVSIHQASAKHGLDPPKCSWLDSARVARRTWEDVAWKGYGLRNLCQRLDYQYQPHDALEDAKAAAYVLCEAVAASGIELDQWVTRVRQPIGGPSDGSSQGVGRQGNPEGDLVGESLVFTGALQIPRSQAANMAAQIGCDVTKGVTKKTTMLVVGDQDVTKLAGHALSSKHRKALELIEKGISIRILRESDFVELVSQSTS
jgi:DNA polymerase-3 subunit epsilon